MRRLLRASFTLNAGASGVEVNADVVQGDLEAAVPVGGHVKPYALYFDPEDTNVKLSKVVLKNIKNDERAYQVVPDGAELTLAALNKTLGPEAGGVDYPHEVPVAHGLRLTVKGSNIAGTNKTVQVLISVHNQSGRPIRPSLDDPADNFYGSGGPFNFGRNDPRSFQGTEPSKGKPTSF